MGKLQKSQADSKQRKRIIAWTAAVGVVILLAAMPMLASQKGADSGQQASILSASAQYQNLQTRIIGGGQLSSEASIRMKIPEEVKLKGYLVGNGDTVSQGDAIATVDKVSVMTAITGVQETLDYLSQKIASASSEEAPDTVKALAGGTVKVIYAQKGEAVQDVMLDHGALAVLSLDDTMAVQLERDTDLEPGDTVSVVLDSGNAVDGRVKSNLNGVLTVTVEDEDYAMGMQVTVQTESGEQLGAGELYIFSPWNATAYSGTVSNILVNVGDSVYVGQTMLKLSDPGKSAEYQQLIDQRQEYEALMQELFTMYRTETITAPCDGIITGVDKDGAFLLSDTGENWVAKLLSFFTEDTEEGFVAYTAKVASVSESGMELLVNPSKVAISDLTALSGVRADLSGMTESWHYSGDQTVYIQNADALLQAAGTAKAGDVLLAVGDAERVHWFVILNGREYDEVVPTDSTHSGLTAQLLSDVEAAADTEGQSDGEPSVPPVVCTGSDGCGAGSHNPGCPMGITALSDDVTEGDSETPPENPGSEPGQTACTGAADCPAQTHDPGCLSQQTDPSPTDTIRIETTALNPGVVGEAYFSPLQASDGTDILSGAWAAAGLPSGLTIDGDTGVISGIPEVAGSFPVTVSFTYKEMPVTKEYTLVVSEAASQPVYRGYVAQVTEIVEGAVRVNQTAYSYAITDLNNLPMVSVDTSAMTVEETYTSSKISAENVAAGDIVLVVIDAEGALVQITKIDADSETGTLPGAGGNPGMGTGELPSGGMSTGGGISGGSGGMGQAQAFTLYSLEKLTVASVTSQAHMTLTVTIDELDISKIYVGQAATITMDALAGESFEATVSQIANSGTNEGGNSKFTVELTLNKSGEMLPGMHASAFIQLSTTEHALCVPVSALGEENGKTVLYTSYDQENGILGDPIVVTIGVADAENVQILDGLSEGDTVYYAYYDTLAGTAMPSVGPAPLG